MPNNKSDWNENRALILTFMKESKERDLRIEQALAKLTIEFAEFKSADKTNEKMRSVMWGGIAGLLPFIVEKVLPK